MKRKEIGCNALLVVALWHKKNPIKNGVVCPGLDSNQHILSNAAT